MNRNVELPIEKVVPNRYQPRTQFDDEHLFELAQSIRENGLIQPIVVRPIDNGNYEIVAGERRYRAMLLTGSITVPAIIADVDSQKSAALALIENIQREDLNVVDEANAYRDLLRIQGITQKELAAKVGKSQSAIANKIRLLELPDDALDALGNRQITERHARALLGVERDEIMPTLNKIVNDKLNVKQTEILVQKPKKKKKPVLKGISQSIKIGVNSIKQTVAMVTKTGIKVEQDIEETDDAVIITLRFPK
ncbi:nucleoid occlusion protein [Erysipelothrix larvae]|uniref:Nucleoid occlusion protein n=1 Tax=Erysipelothrix larvae TaxID=1514105 RepID=A0A0X8H2A0_9FIRM|nr:ParB/RepB/Spo0J family partition protein [Erysipelothrix larvae]AMC94544.1 nucleoid occlusion protein [Erysipelothrix larvae]